MCNVSPGTFADGPLKAVGKLHHAHSILLFLPREWAASFFLKFAYTAHNHCQSHRFLLNKNNFYFRSSVNILEKTDSFCLPFGKSQFSHLTFHKYAKCDAVQWSGGYKFKKYAMSQPLFWKSLSLTCFMQSSLHQNKLISIRQKIFSALNVDEQIKRWIGGVLLSTAGN